MRKLNIRLMEPLDFSASEALNTICSNLQFAGRDLKKIVVTSCNANDGKSYMSLHIAQNIARRGKNILVIDTDLRKSVMVSRYGMQLEEPGEMTGLAHYLAGYAKLDDVVYETNLMNLYFMPIGNEVANPVPLLDSPEFGKMLNSLASSFDMVLIDAAPVGLVIDAAEVARYADGLIFITSYNKTTHRELREAKAQIEATGCPILGCIINQVDLKGLSAKKYYRKDYYNHYGNGYYGSYAPDDGKKHKKKTKS